MRLLFICSPDLFWLFLTFDTERSRAKPVSVTQTLPGPEAAEDEPGVAGVGGNRTNSPGGHIYFPIVWVEQGWAETSCGGGSEGEEVRRRE